jgi:hypothetical protein
VRHADRYLRAIRAAQAEVRLRHGRLKHSAEIQLELELAVSVAIARVRNELAGKERAA